MTARAFLLLAAVGSAIAVTLLIASAATAHGPGGGGIGYVSTVDGPKPPVLGVIARVLGGDDRIQLVNYSGRTVVVRGYEGEPFLRFTSDGVFANAHSPTTYLSRARDETTTSVPALANPAAAPTWRKVTEGSTFAWHDRRIRWTGAELPPNVQAAPDERHLVFRWRIPGRADAKRFAISGYLGYAPPPRAPGPGGTSRWFVVSFFAATAVALLALGALGAGARRSRRQTPGSHST